ncbi:hypothetical protein F3I16_10070 [Pseudomonas sp. L-22-4S-12]|uniref:DUF6482 family protein n=1 Tax=Pseudomonas sp. L-22-4S-12 TaxID=2610893 RepID=UPI001329ED7A|nr:DUF6482 family protein [Pseudomonas sp. L-22-4S-12]MWV16389.1 hypothetical protein [Pseudomonas sp. L-22-4S-12]
MTLHDLAVRAQAGQVEAINLISLTGGIYLLEAQVGDLALPLQDAHGEALHPRSLEHARELLHQLPQVPLRLVHTEVQDEMCGMTALH